MYITHYRLARHDVAISRNDIAVYAQHVVAGDKTTGERQLGTQDIAGNLKALDVSWPHDRRR